MKKLHLAISKKTLFLIIASTLLLFPGFFTNYWQVGNKNLFEINVADGDSFILGRLVQSNQNGIFSAGGLIGLGHNNSTYQIKGKSYPFQYNVYIHNGSFEKYITYNSQIGGQGIFFSIVDKILPFSPYRNLRIDYALTALATTLALTAIILWFYWEFGLFTGVFVLVTLLFSSWLVVFGNKIFWQMWAFYLPMISVMYFLKFNGLPKQRHQYIKFAAVIFTTIVIKCVLNGYEFITTTLVMMVVPYLYYIFREKTPFRKFLNGSLTAVISSSLAILLTLTILCVQISVVEGSFQKGINYIIWSLEKRTYGDSADYPERFAASLNSKVTDVIASYVNESYFNLRTYFPNLQLAGKNIGKIRYSFVIIVFAIFSLFLSIISRNKKLLISHKGVSLVYTTWFSILAPLSWFIIFKAHSFIHTWLDPITWQMPFTIFGFALCGLAIQYVFLSISYLLHPKNKLSEV